LVEDLDRRGLSDDCTAPFSAIVRTPKISPQVGRDHCQQVNCVLLPAVV